MNNILKKINNFLKKLFENPKMVDDLFMTNLFIGGEFHNLTNCGIKIINLAKSKVKHFLSHHL